MNLRAEKTCPLQNFKMNGEFAGCEFLPDCGGNKAKTAQFYRDAVQFMILQGAQFYHSNIHIHVGICIWTHVIN